MNIKKIIPLLRQYWQVCFFALLLLLLIIWGLISLISPKSLASVAPSLKPGSGTTLFTAVNQTYRANLGTTTGEPRIDFEANQVELSFALKDAHKVTPLKIDPKILLYENIQPNTDLKYTTLENGIKEEIIVKQASSTNTWFFDLNLQGTTPQKTINNTISPTFTDAQGHYAFHFVKPFAIDAAGARTDSVLMQIEPNPQSQNTYQIKLIVNQAWLTDPARVYPISIDPTIVHDTTSEFATGQINRLLDTGSGETPSLTTYYQELAADPHTVGLWHFNEASGDALDSSGNSNTGTPTGTTIVDGLMGKARSFDGTSSDYITIADSNSLDQGNTFTFSAWIKPNSLTSRMNIYSSSNNNTSGAFWIEVGPGNGGSNRITASINGTYVAATIDNVLTAGSWHHIAYTRNGTGATHAFYVDGVPVALSTNATNAYVDNAVSKLIGGRTTSTQKFNGLIDEVRIDKVVRTPEQILMDASRRPYSIYTSDVISTTDPVSSWNSFSWNGQGIATGDGETATASATSALVAQWNLNETSGTTAVSGGTCGTSCNGTLTNFASTSSQDAAAGTGWTAANKRWGTGALMFDGADDYINIGDSDTWDFGSNNFSIAAWIKRDNLGTLQIIAAKDVNGTSTRQFFFMFMTTNVLRISYFTPTDSEVYLDSAKSITDSNWHYVVAQRNGNSFDIYIDGALSNSGTTSGTHGTMQSTTTSLSIGRREYSGYLNYFDGTIDTLKIYSRALTDSEILANYNASRLELQTRVGSTTDPNDGTWEAWKPSTTETVINSMDNPLDWATPSATIWTGGALIATASSTLPVSDGSKSMKIQTGQNTTLTGVVGMWHLDETGGSDAYLKDSSGNGNHGTPTGTALVEGISGKARSFNGSSEYVTIPSSTSLTYGTAFSIDAWIKTPTVGWRWLVARPSGSWLGINSSGYLVWTRVGGTDYVSSTNVADGKWHLVGVTFDNGNLKLYVDGVNVSSWTSVTLAVTTGDVVIGQRGDSVEYYSGLIDEVRISNIARTADEIAEAYRMGRDHRISEAIASTDLSTATKLPFSIASDRLGTFSQLTIGESAFANYEPDDNTIGLWHLEEQTGSGAYIKDSTSNGNHGTPTGTTFNQGKIGKGRNFNGSSDYIVPGNTNLPTGNSNYTIEAWMYPTATGARGIVGWGNFGTTNQVNALRLDSTNQIVNYWWGNDFAVNVGTITTAWHHVVATFDGTTRKIYYDGQLSGSDTPGSSHNATNANFRIGNTNSSEYFSGSIDEVRISNIARTAEEIRQAYEIGARTHNITIDFKAKLDATNLITDSSDLGFTVDETAYGSSAAANHLFLGDKIIVKENYDGTEYIAQGTVNAVNTSTGAVTVTAWDTGSTFPSSGYTVGATVFKWQREYFDLTGSLPTNRDAITQLTYRITDGSLSSTVWLDDLRSSTGYLNTPSGSTILSSLRKKYFQYRTILTSTDPSVSSSFSTVSLDYTTSTHTPTTPTLLQPTNNVITNDQPTFSLSSTDSDDDYLQYKIKVCTNEAMTQDCLTFDQTSSQTGWSGQNTQSNTAYNSDTTATYTLQTPLNLLSRYYWTGSVIDPEDTNQWVETATPYTFVLGSILHPSTPCVTQFSNQQITVSWQDQSTNEEGYHLEKKTNNDSWNALPNQATDVVSYLDSVISAGNTYQYRVAPYVADSTIPWCETTTLSIPNPAANPVNMDGVNISGINLD